MALEAATKEPQPNVSDEEMAISGLSAGEEAELVEVGGSWSGRGSEERVPVSKNSASERALLMATTHFALRASLERVASCGFGGSQGQRLGKLLSTLRAGTDDAREALEKAAADLGLSWGFALDMLSMVRTRADDFASSDEMLHGYCHLMERLLREVAKELRPLQSTKLGSGLLAYQSLLRLQDSVGIAHAQVCGCAAAGEALLDAAYLSLVSNLGEQEALAKSFLLGASDDTVMRFNEQCSVITADIAAFEISLLSSKPACDTFLRALDLDAWFEVTRSRLGSLGDLQRSIAEELAEAAGCGAPADVPAEGEAQRGLAAQERSMAALQPCSVLWPARPPGTPLDRLSFEETGQIKIVSKISSGAHGCVYKAHVNNSIVAVKVCKEGRPTGGAPGEETEGARHELITEIAALSSMDHPNICGYLGACVDEHRYAIVLEHVDGGTLSARLREDPRSVDFFSTAIQIAEGMAYMHECAGLMHRDLKSPNILLTHDGTVKIIDFGLSVRLGAEAKHRGVEVGTLRWMAPEVFCKQPYGLEADVYSFGIILWELLTKGPPFEDVPHMDWSCMQEVVYLRLRPKMPRGAPSAVASIIAQCWSPRADERPAFSEVTRMLRRAASRASPQELEFLATAHEEEEGTDTVEQFWTPHHRDGSEPDGSGFYYLRDMRSPCKSQHAQDEDMYL
eukprot:jgi/Tetstr1/424833/TSEL_015336.t1